MNGYLQTARRPKGILKKPIQNGHFCADRSHYSGQQWIYISDYPPADAAGVLFGNPGDALGLISIALPLSYAPDNRKATHMTSNVSTEPGAGRVEARDDGKIYDLDGLKVMVPPEGYGEAITTSIARGGYEAIERSTVPKILRPGDRVLEVGGAIGVVSMAAARVVGAGNVMSFEANPNLIEHARRNFELNALQVNARCAVLQNRVDWGGPNQTLPFYVHKDFWASSLATKPGTVSVICVPTLCLEAEAQAFRANVLVCDIEGGEIDLLTLADLTSFDRIMMEIHYWAGREDINRLMRKLIFEGFTVDFELTGNATVVLHRGLSLSL
jgi:FkbM family methyltransferase